MAISAAAITKLAATVLQNKKLRKGVGNVLIAVLSPLILFVVVLCALLSGTSAHNNAVVDLCFYGGEIFDNAPDEYRAHIEEMRLAFAIVDGEVARVNAMTKSGNGLDGTRLKSIFFTLYFGTENPKALDIRGFVDSFVRYEQHSYTKVLEDGTKFIESCTVAIPLPIDSAYGRFPITVTTVQRDSAADVYTRISSAGDSFSGEILRGDGDGTEIDVSRYRDPSTKNSHDLVTYAEQAFENGWGYVWGTCGWILTDSMFQSKLNQYPDGVGKHKAFIKGNWLHGRTTDCVGLIKGYGWLDPDTLEIGYGTNGMPDISADQMYKAAVVKGSMSTMPDTPGLAVWHKGHIGVYIGNGLVIEAMGTKYGVVKTELAARNWTAWLKIPYINYESEDLK